MKEGFRERSPWPMIKMGAALAEDYLRLGLNLLYPAEPTCPLCGKIIKNRRQLSLCRSCIERVPLIRKPICQRCGRPLRLEASTPCSECRGRKVFYKTARSVGLYRDYFRETILTMKYRAQPELAMPLAELLVERLKSERALRSSEVLVPVPLHTERWMERGYNQAELLARHVGQRCHLPVVSDALHRIKLTGVQNRLNREERWANVHDAFQVSIPSRVSGKSILIIDDILTTGSTASECAKALLAAGSTVVNVLTLAIGVVEEQWTEEGADCF